MLHKIYTSQTSKKCPDKESIHYKCYPIKIKLKQIRCTDTYSYIWPLDLSLGPLESLEDLKTQDFLLIQKLMSENKQYFALMN